jgi:carboxyl-terminal processing protease
MRESIRVEAGFQRLTGAPMAAAARGCLWIAVAASAFGAVVSPVSSAETTTAATFAAVRQAYERVRTDYVDPVDDEKILRAAIDGMLKNPTIDLRRIDGGEWRQPAHPALDDVAAAFDRIAGQAAIEPQLVADAAITGMIGTLDALSQYIDPQKWRANLAAQQSGSVGLNVTMSGGTVRVVGVIENAPAERAGIAAGDTLLAIGGAPLAGMALEAVVARLRGPLNSEVVLTLSRGRDKPVDRRIVRAPVRLPSVHSGVQNDIGYLSLTRLTDQTPQSLGSAIGRIRSAPGSPPRGYVLDLRDNAGGLLDTAVAVTRMFVDRGLIATTVARGRETQRFEADTSASLKQEPVVVLINEHTAAGAEIVAAALQAAHRAIVIGMPSAGAGTIQTVIPLGEGQGALQLTTSRVITAAGRPLDARGVIPDITEAQSSTGDVARPQQDAQLLAAVNYLRKGRQK